MCAWYQNVPAGWSLGIAIVIGYGAAEGGIARRTLSLFPLGETCSPCEWKFVVLKQPTPTGSSR